MILLRNECHDKADAFDHYEKSQRNLAVLDIQMVGYSHCDAEVVSKEIKTDFDEHYFSLGYLSERAVLNFIETHICNRFCRALGLQSLTKRLVKSYNSAVFTKEMVPLKSYFLETSVW